MIVIPPVSDTFADIPLGDVFGYGAGFYQKVASSAMPPELANAVDLESGVSEQFFGAEEVEHYPAANLSLV